MQIPIKVAQFSKPINTFSFCSSASNVALSRIRARMGLVRR